MAKHKYHKGSKLWAWFFIIIGGFFLAQQYGLISEEFGFPWPLFIIVIGIYWLIGHRCNCGDCEIKNS